MKLSIRLASMAVAILALVSCSHTETLSTRFFTVDAPSELPSNRIDTFNPICEGVTMNNSKEVVSIITFIKSLDLEKYLQMQIDGAKFHLRDCELGNVEKSDIGGNQGYKLDFTGEFENIKGKGSIYCFDKGDYSFFIIALGEDKAPSYVDNLVSSINPKPGMSDEELISAVVETAKMNLPVQNDEVTKWDDIEIDKDNKTITMQMKVNGTVADYGENIQEIIYSMHDATTNHLRESKGLDPLVKTSVEKGYSLQYRYVTADDNVVVATDTFTAEELK